MNPSLTIDFYERTHDQQASLGYLVDQSQTREHENDESSNKNNQTSQPHGSVGAVAGRRAIAQGNTAEFAETLFRYTAPEEVLEKKDQIALLRKLTEFKHCLKKGT